MRCFQMGYVIEFIKYISRKSQVVGHQLIWNMRTNMYIDEDMQQKDGMYSVTIQLGPSVQSPFI